MCHSIPHPKEDVQDDRVDKDLHIPHGEVALSGDEELGRERRANAGSKECQSPRGRVVYGRAQLDHQFHGGTGNYAGNPCVGVSEGSGKAIDKVSERTRTRFMEGFVGKPSDLRVRDFIVICGCTYE